MLSLAALLPRARRRPAAPATMIADGTLSALAPGQHGAVRRVGESAGTALRSRLLELGFTDGAEVEVLRRAAFGGPIDVRLRGYRLSLRRDEAAHVLIRPVEQGAAS